MGPKKRFSWLMVLSTQILRKSTRQILLVHGGVAPCQLHTFLNVATINLATVWSKAIFLE